jgi:hypothetical protein
MMMKTCQASDNKEMVNLILDEWNRIYPPGQDVSYTSLLFTLDLFDYELLTFIMLAVRHVTFIELIDELSSFGDSFEIVLACKKVFDVFGEQPWSHLQILLESLKSKNSTNVYYFISEASKNVAPYAPVPKYIIKAKPKKTTKELLEQLKEVTVKQLSKEQIYKKLHDYFVNFEIPEDELLKMKENSKEVEETLIKVFNIIELYDNKEIFKILGPAHPFILENTIKNIDTEGERMFVTNDYEVDDDGVTKLPWFSGNCEKCLLKIRHYFHAVRVPMQFGGWSGCFCSWKCAREAVTVDFRLPIYKYIDYFEKQINKIGILDRKSD